MSKREPDISLVIEYVEHPRHETHHWHANAWVGDQNVCDVWCYTRSVALHEAEMSLRRAGAAIDSEDART